MSSSVSKERLSPPITATQVQLFVFTVACLVAFVWSWIFLGMSFSGITSSFGDVGRLLKRMAPPDFSNLSNVIDATIETVWMAVMGTAGAIVLSFPLALGAARNTSPHPTVRYICRTVISLTRAVPELVLGAVFVSALSIGPLPGVLALAIHSIGMVGKLFADAIEQAAEAPREATISVGATRRQTTRASILPQAMPSMIATALFRLEINIRASTVLGLVGAGGIGFLIQTSLRSLDYEAALGAVSVIFVVVTVVELLSVRIRSSILGEAAAMAQSSRHGWFSQRIIARDTRINKKSFETRALSPPWTWDRMFSTATISGFLLALTVAALTIDIDWARTIPLMPRIITVFGDLFPPDFTTVRTEMVTGIVESVVIAVIATGLGLLIAVPLSLLAARNIMTKRILSTFTRLLMLAFRGIPELIIAVIFVSAMGLGPVPGTLALTVVTASFSAKLFAEALEEVDAAPREAVVAVGAGKIQEFFASVVPQFMPAFTGHFLYILDVNLRSSTVLGIVGGGGIGFLLLNSMRVLEFQTTGAIVMAIFGIVLAIELIGNWVRQLLR
ncbi:MAG: phosphonate transporter, permease protein PhnE [Actinomycetota bacterium]|jgi:phosphonate transport system permease protein